MQSLNQIMLSHEESRIATYTQYVQEWKEAYEDSKRLGYPRTAKYELGVLRSYRMKLMWANQRAAHYAMLVRKD